MKHIVFEKMFSGCDGDHFSFNELEFFEMIFGNYTTSTYNTFLKQNRDDIQGNRNLTRLETKEEFIKFNSNRLIGIAFSYSYWVELFSNIDYEIGDLFNSEVSWSIFEKLFTTPLISDSFIGKKYNEDGIDFLISNQEKDIDLRKKLILNVSGNISYYKDVAKFTIENNYNNIENIFMCPLSKKYFQLPNETDSSTIISKIKWSK